MNAVGSRLESTALRSRQATVLRGNLPKLAAKLAGLANPPNLAIVALNAKAALFETWKRSNGQVQVSPASLDRMAGAALDWLARSQDAVGSGGIGSYEFYGWTRGYPEVTGYIIPTLWDYSREYDRPELARRAVRATDWELSLQRPEGGWEGGCEGDGHPPIVFNTGQVLRGLIRTFLETDDRRYLDAAVRAAEWIVETQESDGSWAKTNFKGLKRVYDSYVAAPLAHLGQLTGEKAYVEAARRSCEFVLAHQRANGWFELCDNSPYFNDAPSTHTIGYTTDGLLETGDLLGDDRLVEAGERTAHRLLALVDEHGRLPGRFDDTWTPRVRWVCLTGSAQLGIILMRLYRRRPEERYLVGATRLLEFLAFTQRMNGLGRNRSGAIAGSFPIWGSYAPFKFPCWATKYLLDLILLHRRGGRSGREA